MAEIDCELKKRKAEAAALDADDGAVVCAPAAQAETPFGGAAAPPAQPGQGAGKPKVVMSQEWIDSVLSTQMRPLPFKERQLRDPKLAAIFQSHERSRARLAEYQAALRRELETKGYVEIDDDYDERCELLQAVHSAAFHGRKEEEKEAMAKLEAMAMRRRHEPSGDTSTGC
ncbi:hypothetical protein ACP4OV_008886 [Aristida adscensionis]